jgi:hypothetical protein
VRTETEADQSDAPGIDVRTTLGVVDYCADYGFPVGTHRQPLLDERAALAGAVEGQHVVTPHKRGSGIGKIQLLGRSVVPTGQDQSGSSPMVVRDPEEIARQGGVFEGDRQHLDRGIK